MLVGGSFGFGHDMRIPQGTAERVGRRPASPLLVVLFSGRAPNILCLHGLSLPGVSFARS